MDQREAVVAADVALRVTKAGAERGVANATKEWVLEVEKPVSQALGEPVLAVAAALELDEFAE